MLVDDAGQPVAARVVLPSGRAHLDQLALAAARAAVTAHPPRLAATSPASGRQRRVRFAFESGVSVMAPVAAMVFVPGTAQPNGGMVNLTKLHFDEASGHVSQPDFVGQKTVHTRITLVGVYGD